MAIATATAVKRWVELTDEDAMLEEWPELLRKFGLGAVGAWRNASELEAAVVHLLTQHGKERVLKRVVGDGLSLNVRRKDGCTCFNLAWQKKNYGLFTLLRELGAAEDLQNGFGKLPSDTSATQQKLAPVRFIN